ncbi:MAG: DsrE family protein [Nitrospirales bacterium]|nr:DsrE family protein [Nitrospira sp.]MDR4499935.1 DsrE family protein [Nitrospirales bacterium]
MLTKYQHSYCYSSALIFAMVCLLMIGANLTQASESHDTDKVKVVYHVDGPDPAVAKYALALINKHIEAEGGPDHIDVVLVVHGPALKLFENANADQELKDKIKIVLDKGATAEMCQVSMKLFGTPLEKLVAGFIPTEHPVAVKRIADLQRDGYVYIKP